MTVLRELCPLDVAGVMHHGLGCPDCGQNLTVAVDWTPWVLLGVPSVAASDIVSAAALHTGQSRSCTTILTEARATGAVHDL